MNARIASLVFVALLPSATAVCAGDGKFVRAGTMQHPRSAHTATLLHDGRVLVAGGWSETSAPRPTAEIYDPATDAFTPVASMLAARVVHTATLLADGRVLIAGGYGPGLVTHASTELFDPATGSFVPGGDLRVGQIAHTATRLPDGRVLIAGGQIRPNTGPEVVAAGAEIYDPATGRSTPAAPYAVANTLYPPAHGPIYPRATVLADGAVLLTGNGTAEVFDPALGAFFATAPMSSLAYRLGMWGHASVRLDDGTVLVTGGNDDWSRLASAERYDPATRSFSPVSPMWTARVGHTSSLLLDGSVLIAGGDTQQSDGSRTSFAGSVAMTERYDPVARIFVPGPALLEARTIHSATTLSDGSVLLAGGVQFEPYPAARSPRTLATAERFVPQRRCAKRYPDRCGSK